jgi:hypothetical protein
MEQTELFGSRDIDVLIAARFIQRIGAKERQ